MAENNEILIPTKVDVRLEGAVKKAKELEKELDELTRERTAKVELAGNLKEELKETKEYYEDLQETIAYNKELSTGTDATAAIEAMDAVPLLEKQAQAAQDNINDISAELKDATTSADKLGQNIDKTAAALTKAKTQVGQLEAQQAKAQLQAMKFDKSALPAIEAQLQAEIAKVDAIDAENARLLEQKRLAEEEMYNNKFSVKVKKTLAKMMENYRQKCEQVRNAISEIGNGEKKASSGISKFGKRIAGLAKRVFIFSLITSGLREIRAYFGKVLQANSEASAAIGRLKGALLTLVQPIVEFVIPIATKLINILTAIVVTLAHGISALFGMSFEEAAENAEKMQEGFNGAEDGAEGMEEALEKSAESLGPFDKLNVISSDSGGGGGYEGPDDPFEEIGGSAPSFDFASIIDEQVKKIEAIAFGAALVLGMILTFTGVNIPLGLAMIVAGALGLYSIEQENPGYIVELLQGTVGKVLAIVSAALLVIGAIILFSGANIPLGLGLMVTGAAGLVAVIAANWDTISEKLQGPLGTVAAALSTALLVLGGVIAFSGANIGLGIALMIAGAAGLATVAAVNWDKIPTLLQGPLGKALAAISGALLVVGGVLAFSGANIPLGIGLMIAGAAGLAAVAAVNWNTIKEKLQGPLGKITAIVSGALLVLGIILLFTGAGIPLGLGLIAAGAAGLAAAIIPNWDSLVTKVTNVISKIKEKWGKAKEWFSTTAGKIKTSFTNAWDKVKTGASNAWTGVKNAWSTAKQWFSTTCGNLKTKFSDAWTKTKTGASNAWASVKSTFSNAGEKFGQIKDKITGQLDKAWEKTKTGASNAWEGIKKPFSNVATWFKDKFKDAWDKVKSVFSKDGLTFQGIKESISDVFKTVVNHIIDGINTVIAAPFNAINGALGTLRDITILGKNPFSFLPTISVPQIPKLASGAVVPPNREFMAMLGDNKHEPEIVSPISTMKEAFMQAMRESGGGRTDALLERLIDAVERKQLVVTPSAKLGQVVKRSERMYSGVTG